MEPADKITGYQQIDLIANEALPRLSQRDQSTIRTNLRTNAELYRKRNRQIGDHRSLLHPLGELRMGAILVDLGYSIDQGPFLVLSPTISCKWPWKQSAAEPWRPKSGQNGQNGHASQ
jgi:hypothetical protein